MSKLNSILTALLRPIALFCLRRGLKFQDFVEAGKSAFVLAARDELHESDERTSKSRLSVMTGLQRRDITRLENLPTQGLTPVNPLSKVLGVWTDHRDYSVEGKPRLLSCEGTDSEFFRLVQSVSRDLNPYAVRFEFERIGAVETKDGKLALKMTSYEPREDAEASFDLLAHDLEDLTMGVAENVFSPPQVPNLHVTTRYDNLIRSALPLIRRWVLERGAQFHAEARAFLSQYDKDLNPALFDQEGGGRMSVGSFSRVEVPKKSPKG